MAQRQDTEQLRALLNAQTAQCRWAELERHFARGVVVKVAPDLDLVEVAVRVVNDDKPSVEQWMRNGKFTVLQAVDARDWSQCDPTLWAVVAAPWVLVQEAGES